MQTSDHQITKPLIQKSERRILSALLFAAAIVFGSHATLATPASAPNPEAGKRACKPDVLRLCKSQIFSGKAAVRACLRENKAELSPECGSFLKQAAEFRDALQASCGSDIQQHCKSHVGKPKAMRACLKEHRTQFSAGCQKFLKETRGESRPASK